MFRTVGLVHNRRVGIVRIRTVGLCCSYLGQVNLVMFRTGNLVHV